jgi:DNA-binding transcriptional LysR family regulator
MDIKDLRTFLAVAQELHFGRAADRLHMAQPPVSRTIRALERELGVTLFNRDTRNVQLTNAGRELMKHATTLVEDFRRAQILVRAAQNGSAGLVRIAYAGASTQVLVGRLAQECRTRLPGVVLELMSQNFAEPAMARVLNGEVDIALGRWDYIPTGVETRTMITERLVLAVPKSHSLAKKKSASIGAFRDDAFVTLTPYPGSVLGDRFRRICHTAGFEPNVVQTAPDTWTALSLVTAGVGCALTLSSVAANVNDPNIAFLDITEVTAPIELKIAWMTAKENAAVMSIIELAQSLAAEED